MQWIMILIKGGQERKIIIWLVCVEGINYGINSMCCEIIMLI